jgi:hypothetical protein
VGNRAATYFVPLPAGRNVQTASMDMLLRLLRDLPGSLEYVRRHAA